MAHPLEEKIGQVRRRARWLLAGHAVSWTVSTLLAAVILLGLADYLIRFQDPGVRLIATLAAAGALGWACYRFLYRELAHQRLGDVQIAQRIERRFPSLTDRLASTIQFLHQGDLDPQAGSAALRRAVIVQTEADVARLDVNQVFESRPTRNALAVLGVVLAIGATLVVLSPSSAVLAVTRLARPFGDEAWPRYYRLEFREAPTRLAAGQTFEVEMIHDEQHRLPEDVRIHFRYQADESSYQEDVEPMRWVGGALVARKENVLRPFEYRAEGGDDHSMPWTALEVLEAPQLAELHVTLHPPAYTGLPVEEAERSIHALRGTRIGLSGSATKRIAKATWRQEDGSEVPLVVADDGYQFSLPVDAEPPIVVDKTGQYWIELADKEGLSSGDVERWDIRAVPDLEPTVTIEQPATNSFVTPQGELPVAIAVKDDLAIHEIALHFQRSDRTDAGDFALPLFQAETEVPRLTEPGLLLGGKLGESRVVEHRWTLGDLKLEPGSQVTFWATASDYLPQTGKSTPRKITIITPAQLEERLAQRQTLVLGELQRVLKLQQDARSQTRSLEIQVNQVEQIAKNDVDHAQSAELNQRQVTRTLTSDTEGIPAQIAEFLSELRANHVDSPGVERNMATILDEIRRLDAEHLKAIESDLTGFIKAAQAKLSEAAGKEDAAVAPDEAARNALAGAGEHQDQVISSLEAMLDELGRWDNYRRFGRDVAELERQQAEIAARTKELAPKTLGRDFKSLGEQQQADLRKLATEQAELSRRLERTQQQMGDMSRKLEEQDPVAAATISDGLHHARERAISNQMRDSGRQLEQNQLGQAAQQQQRISQDLAELQSILSNRKEQELARLVKQLRDAETELDQLRQKQAGLRKKMKDAEQISDPEQRKRELQRLAREQKQLAEDAQRMARRLARLQAAQAGRSTTGASNKMSDAGEKGEQGDSGQAGEQAAAAEKDLEEARQQLAERRKQAEQDLANEQLARMEDSLKALHDRQQKLIQETQRLEQLRVNAQRLSRAELATLGDLARQQVALGDETDLLGEKLAATEVIHLALSGAARQMDRAAELLELRETGMQAQGAQESARARLARLLSAFENKKPPGDKKQDSGGGSGSGGQNSRSDGNLVLTQLKLLKLLQEDLNDRYRELMSGDQAEGRRLRRDLTEIAEEQGRLAELTLKLSTPPTERPEDDPENLPDVREPAERDAPDELGLPDLDAVLKAGAEDKGESDAETVPPPDASIDPTREES